MWSVFIKKDTIEKINKSIISICKKPYNAQNKKVCKHISFTNNIAHDIQNYIYMKYGKMKSLQI